MTVFPPSNDKEGWMSFVMKEDSVLAIIIREDEEALLEVSRSFIDRYAAKVSNTDDSSK